MKRLTSSIDRAVQILINIIIFIAGKIANAWRSTLGTVSWNKPKWAHDAGNTINEAFENDYRNAKQWIDENPERFRVRVGVAIIALVLGYGGWRWYESRPKPVTISINVTAPQATPLKEDARPDPLILAFSAGAAKLEFMNKVVTKGIEMNPHLDGTWRWEGDTNLVFRPKTDWPVGEEYTVTVRPPAIASNVILETNTVKFHSAYFEASVDKTEYYQHPENPKEKRVVAQVHFTHPVDKEDFKKHVSFELKGTREALGGAPTKYGALVSFDKFDGTAYIQSDLVPIPAKDCTMVMTVSPGFKSIRGGKPDEHELNGETTVPGMFTYFKFERTSAEFVENDRYELDQVLILNTSTEVNEKEFDKALSVYLLPRRDHKGNFIPEDAKPKRKEISRWSAVGEISPEVLQHATKLTVTRVPSEHPNTTVHTFKFQAPPERQLYVKVEKGLKSFQEYVLAANYEHVVNVPDFTKSLKILHDGSILALSGDKKLSVLVRGVPHVRLVLDRVMPGQINNLITQAEGKFQNPEFVNSYKFNQENITEEFTKEVDFENATPSKPSFTAVDFDEFLKKGGGNGRGLFFLTVQEWDPENKRPLGQSDHRFILLTDLGVIAKNFADSSHAVFVQGLHSGLPVAGASVEVMGKNGLPVITAATNADGQVRIPDLKDFKNEKQPVAYVVKRGSDVSFLPFNWSGRELNLSRFDVGGLYTTGETEKLVGYLFSDRGIYRPGEEFRIGAIVKSYDWKTNVDGMPAEWVVTDPRGAEVYKERISLANAGFVEMRHKTEDVSPTGTYNAVLYTVKDGHRQNILGSVSVRIEEFQPDKIKISSGFSKAPDRGWIKPEGLKAWVHVQNLFGSNAEQRRVTATLELMPSFPSFREYAEYRFYDPVHTDKTYSETLEEKQTDAKGDTEFDLNLEKYAKATYRLTFHADAFEAEGGRGVATESTAVISPLSHLIGYKSDGDLNYIKENLARAVNVIAIDPNLKKIKVDGLKIELLERKYVSVLMKKEDGTFRYESVRRDQSIKEDDFTVPENGAVYPLPTSKAGDFALAIKDKDGTELNKIEFSVIGETNILGRLDKNAELQVKLNKTDFAPGEDVEMHIQAPYTGSGLITIERDKVYAVKWFKTNSTGSVQRIKVPAGLEGNGYVNVTFLRDPSSKEVFQSPLSYGVVPFSVARAKRTNNVDLKLAHDVRPGQQLKITYKTAKPGKVVIFAVDEGILQVAGYKTPDPLAFYFRKRALEVRTLQLLDLLLPEYHIVKELSAAGGDMEGARALGRNLNPFKRKGKAPVAFWSGILDSDGTPRTVTYDVPDYFNGSLRIMAVAVSKESVGRGEDRVSVRGDFIISPTVPVFTTPGDEFEVGYSVSNQLHGSGENAVVKMSIKTAGGIELISGATQDLKIAEGREAMATVKFRTKDELGTGLITFVAESGGKSAKESEDLSIRPANPYRTSLNLGALKKGRKEVAVSREIYPNFSQRKVSASVLPLGLAHGLLQYLEHFPYGCTEQLISQAFPYLILKDRAADFEIPADKPQKAFKQTIDVLRARQTGDGGFGLWDGNEEAPFPSLYGIHYLVEAQDHGFAVPRDLIDRAASYLSMFARRSPDTMDEARNDAFALYLLARMGQNQAGEAGSLKSELDQKFKDWNHDITALFLGATYKMYKQDSLADKLLSGFKPRISDVVVPGDYFDGLVQEDFLVSIVARHFPERMNEYTDSGLDAITDTLMNGAYNTLNSALSIMALDTLSRQTQNAVVNQFKVFEKASGAKEETAISMPSKLFSNAAFSPNAAQIAFVNEGDTRIFYQTALSGFDRKSPDKPVTSKIDVQHEYQDKTGKAVTSVKIGDEVTVHVRVRSVDNAFHANVAVVDLIPAGFDFVVEHPTMGGTGQSQGGEGGEGDAGDPGDPGEGGGEGDGASIPAPTNGRSPASLRFGSPETNWAADFVEPREDRVVIYGTVNTSASDFVYRIRAVSRGKFKIPPPFAEGMYDRTVQAEGTSGSIEVTAP